MKAKKGSKQRQSLLFGSDSVADIETLTDEDKELLARLGEAGFEGRGGDLVEGRFRKKHPDLHFALRGRFSSFCNALAIALKHELGSPLTAREMQSFMKREYASGRALTLESLVARNPLMARAIVAQWGSLSSALEDLDIAASIAAHDRRWDKETIFAEVLDVLGDSPATPTEEAVREGGALLAEVLLGRFGNFSSFKKEFAVWLVEQPALFVVRGRNVLSRILLSDVGLASRPSKGKGMPGVQRVRWCATAPPGDKLYAVSSDGLIYPVDVGSIPFLTSGALDGKAAVKMPAMGRGEKPVALVSLDVKGGALAMVTRRGRLKLVDVGKIKRIRQAGTTVLRLAADDQLAAAAVIPAETTRLAIVTRNGRAVAFQRDSLKLSTRTSMGVIRVRFEKERNAEPLALIGFRGDEDVLLLGRNANLLRLRNSEIPTRKGASLGRRLWRTPVIAASAVPEQSKIVLASRKGRVLSFWDSQVPRRHVLRRGVMGIRLDPDDAPESLSVVR